MSDSTPPSPLFTTNSLPPAPGQHSSNQSANSRNNNTGGMNYFSVPFERFAKDEFSGWTTGFTLLGELRLFNVTVSALWLACMTWGKK